MSLPFIIFQSKIDHRIFFYYSEDNVSYENVSIISRTQTHQPMMKRKSNIKGRNREEKRYSEN